MASFLPKAFPVKALYSKSTLLPAGRRAAIIGPSLAYQIRTAASSVSSKPASTGFAHAAQNVKEELGDALKAVQGDDSQHKEDNMLEAVFGGKISDVPKPFMFWGTLGVVPYVATGLTSVWTARAAHYSYGTEFTENLTILASMEHLQITAGALILSSLGFMHWGFEAAKLGGEHGHTRLLMGVAPILAAWPTLYVGDLGTALSLQMATFFGMWVLDRSAGIWGWTPSWYTAYRFYLTSLLGVTVLFTFIGNNYFAPDYQSKEFKDFKGQPAKHRLNALNASETPAARESTSEPGRGMTTTNFEHVHSNVHTIPMEGTGEVAVHDVKAEAEEAEKAEEQKKEDAKKEAQDAGNKNKGGSKDAEAGTLESPGKNLDANAKKQDAKPEGGDSAGTDGKAAGDVSKKGDDKGKQESHDTGPGKHDDQDIKSKKGSHSF